jgi:hypothetical protein
MRGRDHLDPGAAVEHQDVQGGVEVVLEHIGLTHRSCRRRQIVEGAQVAAGHVALPGEGPPHRLRRERRRNAPVAAKSRLLRAAIDDELRLRALRSQLAPRSDIAVRSTSYEQGWSFLTSVEASTLDIAVHRGPRVPYAEDRAFARFH